MHHSNVCSHHRLPHHRVILERSCASCPSGSYNEMPGGTSLAACSTCPGGTTSTTLGAVSNSTCKVPNHSAGPKPHNPHPHHNPNGTYLTCAGGVWSWQVSQPRISRRLALTSCLTLAAPSASPTLSLDPKAKPKP